MLVARSGGSVMQRPALSPVNTLTEGRLSFDHIPSNRYIAYTPLIASPAASRNSPAGLVAQRFTGLRMGFPLD